MIVLDVRVMAEEGFFFVKKKQKTFLNWYVGVEIVTNQRNEVFRIG
jgi:hypothetical protein